MLAIFSSSSQIKAQEDVSAVSPLSKAGSSKGEHFESHLGKAGSNEDFENENISLMWSLTSFQSG